MKVKAARLHGKNDLRFDEFEMRDIRADEMLVRIVTDSLCMSTYKAMLQGSGHRCIPDGIADHPVVVGHELCGVVVQVGEDLADIYNEGDVFTVQPKMDFGGIVKAPGYSYQTYGGNATYAIIPSEVIRGGYVLPFKGKACYMASMAEPVSCLISALRSHFHLSPDKRDLVMGLKPGGSMVILAGCGPMGLGAAEVAMASENRPSRIVLTDIDTLRTERAKALIRPRNGVSVEVLNTRGVEDETSLLIGASGGSGFDDILIMAPVRSVIETADAVAGVDSCINFFAGPTKEDFFANVNFYDVHYNYKHIIGTSGGDTDDMKEALLLIEAGEIDVSMLISHIGGLNAVVETTMNLPDIPGAKKLIYCGVDMELTAISDFEMKGKESPIFAALHEICAANNMLWSSEAEEYLLKNAKPI